MVLTLTKQQAIYQHIKGQILSGELPPGQRLIIDDIANDLGLSIIPVREALQLLQSERLVEIRPHAGATVTPITKEDVEEVFTILEGMEAMAVRYAILRQPAELITRLKSILSQIDSAQKHHDLEKWSSLNVKFHLTISESTGMPILHEITSRALARWDRIRRYFFHETSEHRLAEAQREHHAILKALEKGDAEQAEKLSRQHNQKALKHYSLLMAKADAA